MKKMYKFIITATSPEAQSIDKVNDLPLAIQIFHANAECGAFDHVDLVDGQTGEVHAHTCGEGKDYYLSDFLTEFMLSDMERMLDEMFGQPTDPAVALMSSLFGIPADEIVALHGGKGLLS